MCAKAVNGPSLARSVPKPLKGPSLARSVPKPLKVPSLARSVPKPFKVGHEGGGGHQEALCFAPRASLTLHRRQPTPLVICVAKLCFLRNVTKLLIFNGRLLRVFSNFSQALFLSRFVTCRFFETG